MFSFGENDLYDQISNPAGSSLRQWQTKMKEYTRVAPVLFYGRGFGLLPHRRPIHTVCKFKKKKNKKTYCGAIIGRKNLGLVFWSQIHWFLYNKINVCASVKEAANYGFGIHNRTQGIRNPTKVWNPRSNFHLQRLEASTWNPASNRGVQSPRLSWILYKWRNVSAILAPTVLTLYFDPTASYGSLKFIKNHKLRGLISLLF